METTVTRIGSVVVAELRAAGYMESTIGQYEKTIKALTKFAEEHGGAYTPSLGAQFASMTVSPRTGRFSAQRQVRLRPAGQACSTPTCGPAGWTCRRVNAAAGASSPNRASSQRWLPRGRRTWTTVVWRRQPATLTAGSPAATWCFWNHAGSAVSRTPMAASVLAFLESLSARWATSSLFWVVSNFRPFLKFTGRTDLVDAVSLAGVKRSHAILPVLGDDERELVVHACASGVVSARDAAITLLALTTGLRACDIIALRLADIDWRGQDDRDRAAEDAQPVDGAADWAAGGQARRLRPGRTARLRR